MKYFFICLISLMIPSLTHASYTPYCKGTEVTNAEDAVIQRLVPRFANTMKCEVGENCLLKWDVKDKKEKFSIAWKQQCGPVINSIHQLGDDGQGSTFECQFGKKDSVCCWPLGYKRLKNLVLCSDSIIKK